jgi:DNA-binding transcriptional MocR family regulator
MSLERRQETLRIAGMHDVLVLEDDPYGLVRFEGEPPPSLHELAGGEGVVYASSFSKTVAPGVRVGYFVLPRDLAAAVEAIAVQTSISPALIGQATVWELIRRGAFEPNLVRVNSLLKVRRDAMLSALEGEFGDSARWSRPAGGYFVWLDLPPGVDCNELLSRAQEHAVTFVAGTDFFPTGRGGAQSARLAYSFVAPDEIDEGIARLAALARSTVPV